MDKHLDIICHDVAYRVDYGGVFDLFHKIQALHEAGIKIHLHCFEYRRARQPELNKYCETVRYYKRTTGPAAIVLRLPYIVSSRKSRKLTENLLCDRYPILVEGIHCTHFLNDKRFSDRRVLLRLHNAEYLYYRNLAQTTNSVFKKIYYWAESLLLFRYEKRIAAKVPVCTVSEKDKEIYQETFGAKECFYLPVFLPYKKVLSPEGLGSFCLYHGNLSVAENEKSALWLLQQVFETVRDRFIVAGKDPSENLRRQIAKNPQASLIANPSTAEMAKLIEEAQVHVLPSLNNTGVKLKLLNALFNGRHCIVNENAVEKSDLRHLCHIANDPVGTAELIFQLSGQAFTDADIARRKTVLEGVYENFANAQKLIQWIW